MGVQWQGQSNLSQKSNKTVITRAFSDPLVPCTNVQCLQKKQFVDILSVCFLEQIVPDNDSSVYSCLVWSNSPESSFKSQQ